MDLFSGVSERSKLMRKKSFKLTKETDSHLVSKRKGNAEIIAKFAVQLLILILLIRLIIYSATIII